MKQNRLPYKRLDYNGEPSDDVYLPKSFELMKQYSKKMSKDFKFVRVDFYEENGCIYLGELTFTPGAFIVKYEHPEDEITVGNLLKL